MQTVQTETVKRFKKRRKEQKISQKALAAKSGVAYASIRRFESTGEISFSSLLKLAQASSRSSWAEFSFENDKLTITVKYFNGKRYDFYCANFLERIVLQVIHVVFENIKNVLETTIIL